MRVAFLLPSLAAGGAQRQFAQLAQAMAARGHEVLFVTCVPGGPYWERVAAVLGARLVALAERDRSDRLRIAGRLPALTWRLARVLRRHRIEIVYSALHIANLLAWLATGGSRTIPLCWGMRAARHDLGWRQRLPFELCRRVSGGVDLLLANSSAGLAEYRASGYRARLAEVIPNGIDVDGFRPDPGCREAVRAELGCQPGATVVGMVGRLVSVKDHPTFLAAAAALGTEHPHVRFVVVGDGPAAYRRTLQAEAEDLGLVERLVWAGERTDMARVYQAFDVFCLSSASEGFPNVLAEAMACGLPAVATDVGDARRILGDTGDIVPPRDPPALAAALGRCLAAGAERRAALGEAARARIVEHYAVAAMVSRTEAALAEAIGRHRHARVADPVPAAPRVPGGRAP
jgi:glycosyltransferase involved in cell wall biosynthesis